MNLIDNRLEATATFTDTDYDLPTLRRIGHVGEVVMGVPGGGFDGPYGMTDLPFEFEEDDLE
jgi:hypothetical protein